MLKKWSEMNGEEAEKFVLELIGCIDYDIEKQCRVNLNELYEDQTIDEVYAYLDKHLE